MESQGIGKIRISQGSSLEVMENIGHLIACVMSKDITVLLQYFDTLN